MAALSAEHGGLAVLFGSGPSSTALLLDGGLGVQYQGPVPTAHGIVRGADALLCESSVECYGLDGTYQWSFALDARPQAMLASEDGDLFVFAGNLVQRVTPPSLEAESSPEG